jgi:alkanesulfonate monooxygenase SsuD/methylene tetrahydromethanopterin reductase-like flavin-dependent oxidoreductase (luciferase family)
MMAPFGGLTWAESAREIESLGYSTLFVPDHLDEGYGPITAMATAAAATTTLRVAPAVLAADFRHPAVLARELASIDQLSEGRLEVGIGAGYQVNDYAGAGLAMDPPGTRVARMIEHVTVLRGLFADGPFDFAGEIVERLHERRDRWGYSYYTIQQLVAREFAPVLARLGG